MPDAASAPPPSTQEQLRVASPAVAPSAEDLGTYETLIAVMGAPPSGVCEKKKKGDTWIYIRMDLMFWIFLLWRKYLRK